MKNQTSFMRKRAAVVFGETNLTIECLKLLIKSKWDILLVVTDDDLVSDWCHKMYINTDNYLNINPIDQDFYLFSIINSCIIPGWYLAQSGLKLAINYHDSLLPKYSGLNSTTWSILNDERIHGITWHIIDKEIDKGDILKQSEFYIDDDETVRSLNMKCTEYAYLSFIDILMEISDNICKFHPQEKNFPNHYYGKKSIPTNYALLTDLSDIDYVSRLERSLDFGPEVDNNIASLKIRSQGVYYIVSGVSDSSSSGVVEIVDSKGFRAYAKCLLSVCGEQVVGLNHQYHIDNVCYKQSEISYLSLLKKGEGDIKKIIKRYVVSGAREAITKKSYINKICVSIDLGSNQSPVTPIVYLLSRLLGEHDIVTFYHNNNSTSKTLKDLVMTRSFINPFDCAKNFTDCLSEALNKKYETTKDYDHRYHLNLNTEICISESFESIGAHHDISIVYLANEIRIMSNKSSSLVDMIHHYFKNIEFNIKYDAMVSSIDNMIQLENVSLYKTLNNTSKSYNNSLLLHEIFERQADLTPNSIAVQDRKDSLTYRQLDNQANTLSHHLHKNKMGSRKHVSVSLSRSVQLIVAILAVLKSGSAYVPIDDNYPDDRKKYIHDDSCARLLIVDSMTDAKFHSWPDKLNVDLVDMSEDSLKCKPNINITMEDKAYIIYTSGTSGKPKGVVITHKNITERMLALLDIYRVNEGWVHLQYGSYSFDASLEEMFLALSAGGKVVIANENAAKDPDLLIKYINDYCITAINFVPSVLQIFLDTLNSRYSVVPNTLSCVISGGEVLTIGLVRKFYNTFGCPLFNTYGPTENTINSTFHRYTKNSILDVSVIGRPLPNSSVYVLNSKMDLLGTNQVGELYVGGSGVSDGYYNKPALNNESFIDCSIDGFPNVKLYKTGDLVVINSNLQLEYIGRSDDQVKIRGCRIEISEIHKALCDCNLIDNIAIQVRENPVQGKFIAAYFVSSHDSANEVDIIVKLREMAMRNLPNYMLPATYMRLNKMPLTENGKLDVRALPEPIFNSSINKRTEGASELESILLLMFEEVLGLSDIDINASFFDIGGHSLMAIYLVSKLSSMFNDKIPVKILFQNPTVIMLAKYLNDLYKTDSFDFNNSSEIPYLNRCGDIVLSYQQQAIWFVDKMQPGVNAYDIPAIYKFSGKIDPVRLNLAIVKVINKNEILRSVFKERLGSPFVQFNPCQSNVLTCVDGPFDHLDEDDDMFALRFSMGISKKGYDLSTGPLYKFTLLNINADTSYLFINIHHIVFDGISSGLLTDQITHFYNNKHHNESDTPSAQEIQYADFASWQRNKSSRGLVNDQLNFWEKQFISSPKLLSLPLDFIRPKLLTLTGKSINFSLSKENSTLLYCLAESIGSSLYSVLLSAYTILLSKYSGQNDIVIGTAVSSRSHPACKSMIGLFVNILPLRLRIGDGSATKFIQFVNRYVMDALSNQDISLEELFKKINIERDSSYHPLFQCMFVMENTENEQLSLNGVESNKISPPHHESKYDVSLYVDESERLIKFRFEYNQALFKHSTIQSMIDSYLHILDIMVKAPEVNLNNLNVMCPRDISVLDKLNQTEFDFEKGDFLLHHLFEYSAKDYPQRIALKSDEIELSYSQLNDCVNSLSESLQKKGVIPGDVVSILMTKSWRQVVSVLAILKIGAVYLPLSYDDPDDRINVIVNKARAKLNLISECDNKRNIQLESLVVSLSNINRDHANLLKLPTISKHDLAYIIFTSGSSGEPKGVMINHNSAVNTILDINDRFGVDQRDVVYGLSELNFDLSVYDVFGTLAAGATLVLPGYSDKKDPLQWLSHIEKHGITIWNTVPALMQMLVDYIIGINAKTNINSRLRLCLLSGDWLPLSMPEKLTSTFGDKCQVVSLGGATEASIWSILYIIKEINPNWISIPYGFPMRNQNIYILNERLQPVPVGVRGELFIGGSGVGAGYLSDKKKTEDSFIYSHVFKCQLYKTGDLGRAHSSGYIEFLGRKDTQVKINGYRIELGEVQSKLLSYPGVDQSVVTVRRNGDQQDIVAYVTAKINNELHNAAIINYLRSVLPMYMLPSSIQVIDKIPLTLNGKVDTKSLPDFIQESFQQDFANEIERDLYDLWCDIITENSIKRDSHFFSCGGDSLLSVRLSANINKHFGVNVSIRMIFEYPVFSDMAAVISAMRGRMSSNKEENEDELEFGVI